MKAKGILVGLGLFIGFGLVVTVALAVFLARFLGLSTTAKDFATAKQKLEARGVPLSAAKLAEPPVSEDQDAAVVLTKLDKLLDVKKTTNMSLFVEAFYADGYDPEAGHSLTLRSGDVYALAVEATNKPKCNLKLKWLPTDEDGYFDLDGSLYLAGRLLVIEALDKGYSGQMDEAIEDLARCDHLTDITILQARLDYVKLIKGLHNNVDRAVLRLADHWQDDPEKLEKLTAFSLRPRQAMVCKDYFVSATNYRLTKMSDLGNAVDKDSPGRRIDPVTSRATANSLVASQSMKIFEWANKVLDEVGSETSVNSWMRALDKAQKSMAKRSRTDFIDATTEFYNPLISRDLAPIQRDIDRRLLSAVYPALLKWRKVHGQLPENLAELNLPGTERLVYYRVEDGFNMWSVIPGSKVPNTKDPKALAESQPDSHFNEFDFRPRL